MIPIINYLGRCFYQLTSVEQPDRAGTSRMLLSLFFLFFLLDVYTIISVALGARPQFALAAIGCFTVAQLAVRIYSRRSIYQQLLVTYAEPEPERLRLALLGVGLLLAVLFIPFLLLHMAKGI